MSSDENVAIMQRAYDAFNVADIDTLTEVFDENIVWHLPGQTAMAQDYEGRDATLAYFGKIGEDTGGTFQAELQQLFAGDDGRVIGLQRSTGERGDKRLDVSNCIVFELKDGKVVDGREHFNDLYAWDQFWS
jgi:ketosteroid isomerase-like protein